MWTVEYPGFLQRVRRQFATKEDAETWARQCGVFAKARIEEAHA